jgi:RNA polymerase sigma factor (sigma-70 family)
MNDWTDQQLLHDYAERRSDAAFGELVRRHIDAVYSVAWRMTGEEQSSRDAAQAVFVALAQNAGRVANHPVLSGWLHCTARNMAAKSIRSEVRRRAREQEAVTMNQLSSDESGAAWENIAPELDAALGELNESDRDAVTLRYFEKKSAPEMAGILGISDEAAQKRVSRAVERLRELFAKRGVTVGASGLAVLISANAVQSAPVGLATTIAASAALTGTTLATTVVMTLLQKTVITVALVAAVGAGVYEGKQAANARAEELALRQQQAPLGDQIQHLQKDLEVATNRLAGMTEELAQNRNDNLELLRLRGMAGVARRAVGEAEQLRAQLVRQASDGGTNLMMGAMADSMKRAFEQQVEGRLSRMTAVLHLTQEQTQAIRDILMKQAQVASAGAQQALSGKFDKEELIRMAKESGDPEAQIKALLTLDQQAAYPACQQEEAAHTASLAANSELLQMQSILDLAAEQSDRVYAALYDLSFNEITGKIKPPATNMVGAMQWMVDQKAKALEAVLNSSQMDKYRQQLATQAKLQQDILGKLDDSGVQK